MNPTPDSALQANQLLELATGVSLAINVPADLLSQALELRSLRRYALHPVEAVAQSCRYRAEGEGTDVSSSPNLSAEVQEEQSHHGIHFEQAKAHYRRGAQRLRLSEIPQLPQQLRELSRLGAVDRAGSKALRIWAEEQGHVIDEAEFLRRWQEQGKRGGAEHQVYHDEDAGRWFKRLYDGVNQSTLGDYLIRMRLHALLFPETAYRLEGFTINPRSKEVAPVVSQPHVEVDTTRHLVSRDETDDLMASMGYAPVLLFHDGVADNGYFAYLHPVTGILAHDLHDENVVRLAGTDEFAVIDPYVSLARQGTWAAIKLAEIGYPAPPDDALDEMI